MFVFCYFKAISSFILIFLSSLESIRRLMFSKHYRRISQKGHWFKCFIEKLFKYFFRVYLPAATLSICCGRISPLYNIIFKIFTLTFQFITSAISSPEGNMSPISIPMGFNNHSHSNTKTVPCILNSNMFARSCVHPSVRLDDILSCLVVVFLLNQEKCHNKI